MTKHLHLLILASLCLWIACKPEKDDPTNNCATPPVASFTADKTSGNVPLTVTFDNNSLGATSYLWNFGAGTTSTLAEPTYTFNAAGTYSVSLIASSSAGCKDTTSVVITVTSVGGPVPVASFTITNGGCTGPCAVVFSNTSTDAITFQWDFGDGSPGSTQLNPTHTYQIPGDYLVSLTASGPGGTDTEIKSLTIQPQLVQKFKKAFGGTGFGFSVQQTSDGGYILLGGGGDFILIKTDNAGNLVWERTFGGLNEDIGYSVRQTSDGGFILLGSTRSEGAGETDFYLIKTDNIGNLVWEKTYGGTNFDVGYAVQQTSDGGYVLLGYTTSQGAGQADIYLLKTDNSGNLLWTKTFGGTNGEDGRSVQQTADGGYILFGTTQSQGAGSNDFLVLKTDNIGNLVWQKTFGGIEDDYGFTVQKTNDGGYILLGRTSSEGAGSSDAFLIKTDNNGNQVWKKTFGGTNFDYVTSGQQTTDGGYILFGSTASEGAGGDDFYLLKTDNAGNLMWKKTFGGVDFDYGRSVQQTTDGGYILFGSTANFVNGNADFYLIKTDKDGNAQ